MKDLCIGSGVNTFASAVAFFGIASENVSNSRLLSVETNVPILCRLAIYVQPNREELARKLSPLTYVRKGLPPIMSIQGDADPIVPNSNSTRLGDALTTGLLRKQRRKPLQPVASRSRDVAASHGAGSAAEAADVVLMAMSGDDAVEFAIAIRLHLFLDVGDNVGHALLVSSGLESGTAEVNQESPLRPVKNEEEHRHCERTERIDQRRE